MFVCQILNTGQLQHSGTTQPKNVRIQPRCTSTSLNFAKNFKMLSNLGPKKEGSIQIYCIWAGMTPHRGISHLWPEQTRAQFIPQEHQQKHFCSSSSSSLRPPCQEIVNFDKSEMMFRNTFTHNTFHRGCCWNDWLTAVGISLSLLGNGTNPQKLKSPPWPACLTDFSSFKKNFTQPGMTNWPGWLAERTSGQIMIHPNKNK